MTIDKKKLMSEQKSAIAKAVLDSWEETLLKPINKEWLYDYSAAAVLLMGWALDTVIADEDNP